MADSVTDGVAAGVTEVVVVTDVGTGAVGEDVATVALLGMAFFTNVVLPL